MKKHSQKGFGVLEVVIACMILVTVVGAVVALGNASVKGSVTASDKTVAYNLVQECLEAVRAERNTAWLDSTSAKWYNKFLSNPSTNTVNPSLTGGKCSSSVSVGTPAVSYSRSIRVDNVSWYSASPTPITDTSGTAPDRIRKVSVSISWIAENGSTKTVRGSTYLTDWKAIQ